MDPGVCANVSVVELALDGRLVEYVNIQLPFTTMDVETTSHQIAVRLSPESFLNTPLDKAHFITDLGLQLFNTDCLGHEDIGVSCEVCWMC